MHTLLNLLFSTGPLGLLFTVFWLWMVIDAIRREEWLWVVFLIIFPPLNTILYFFLIYRDGTTSGGGLSRGFELPGAHDRRRIKELQGQIYHLDKAHHHSQLGDIYFQQGKLDKAEACYKAAMQRDAEDIDTRAHYGQCLLLKKQLDEALKLLEGVCQEDPRHEYGHTRMALAEAYMALGRKEDAIKTFEHVLETNNYSRAKVQLSGLYIETGRHDEARGMLREVLEEDAYAPNFQRKRDRYWVRQAKKMIGRV